MDESRMTDTQLHEFVSANIYPLQLGSEFLSRCIDGRPVSQDPNLKIEMPALSLPGADAGELAVIFAAANNFGYELNYKAAFKSLTQVVGRETNIRFHTDSHAKKDILMAGCGYMQAIYANPEVFDLTRAQADFINHKFNELKREGVKEVILHGDHHEEAVFYIEGNFGLYPQHIFQTQEGPYLAQVFVFHRSLVNKRHKVLAKSLFENKAIKIIGSSQTLTPYYEEVIYTALCETVDEHLAQITQRLVRLLKKSLLIYLIKVIAPKIVTSSVTLV